MSLNNNSTNDISQNFHHPYEPYEIQKQLMKAVYGCIENGNIGIFESPTGTGKSLSLICASLTWLRDHKRKTFQEGLSINDERHEEPDWMLEYSRKQQKDDALAKRADMEARLAKIRVKEIRAQQRYQAGELPNKRQKTAPSGEKVVDEVFALEDYESEDDRSIGASTGNSQLGLSKETQKMMEQLGMFLPEAKADEDIQTDDELKIFYCSRTHSQLTQFINELRRVKMPPAMTEKVSQGTFLDHDGDLLEEFKHVTLGSRKTLCINAEVNKLGNAPAINERCLELQQPKTPSEAKCPYVPSKEKEALLNDFRDHALASIRDIEDFGTLGRKIGVCPYYASRATVRPSEIVTLPYPLLLQKSARESLGLSVKGHVVIIDEAHNLMDTISNIHSVSVTLSQLQRARSQLGVYLQKFRNRLKGKNRVYITQLIRLVDSLSGYMQSKAAGVGDVEDEVSVGDLMTGKGVDTINMYKLMHYLQESKLARKVDGYIEFETQKDVPERALGSRVKAKASGSLPVITHIQGFLLALTYPAAEGRFFYAKSSLQKADKPEVTLKYLLLDPTHHFRDIVNDARAVILIGGTMSPMSDYTNHLVQYLPADRIATLSCGHVIPPSNLLALPISKGPSGIDFEFSFGKRDSDIMIRDLGLCILDLTARVPDGLVVFFPSYAYLDTAVQCWNKHKLDGKTVIQLITGQKQMFSEPRSNAPRSPPATTDSKDQIERLGTVDEVLAAYTVQVNTGTGALLLAVIGGSLSEGINFSDRLGRGVAVVGLPFPNPNSPEWKAKLQYVERRSQKGGKDATREFLENACMRAVNQSVGRAIRHRNDYAAIFLLDKRFERESISSKLPGWIKDSVSRRGYSQGLKAVEEFFEGKT